jgi:hypothetical protein
MTKSSDVFSTLSGGGEIRTHGALRHGAFQVRWNKPLSDASSVAQCTTKPAFFQVVLLVVAIGANYLQVREFIIGSIPVTMVYVQNLPFIILTAFALRTSQCNELQFNGSECLCLIIWSPNFIFNTSAMLISTRSTTRLFVSARKNLFPTHRTGMSFTIGKTHTHGAAKNSSR